MRAGAAYQGAVEAVLAVLVGAGIGYWLDTKLDTSPWIFLAGLLLGFCAFIMRLLRMRRLIEDSPADGDRPAD